MLISKFEFIIKGFTVEDYIFLYCQNTDAEKFIETIKNIKITASELSKLKLILKKEIQKKTNTENEKFFKRIWKKTIYEKSPRGDLKLIDKINIKDIMNLKYKVLKMPLYFYGGNNKVNILNGKINYKKNNNQFNVLYNRYIFHKNTHYNIIYFINEIEKIYIIEKILQQKNPTKHIQISEKRKMSALILEKNCVFPQISEINFLKEKALEKLKTEINQIKKNFCERALNELESVFFYNIHWVKRIKKLFNISENDIIRIIKKVEKGIGK